MRKNLSILVLLAFVFGCQHEEPKRKTKQNLVETTSDDTEVDKIKKIFYSLPSPLEMTVMFKKEGVLYHENSLHDVKKRSSYHTSFKKALNLGVYGADLSYSGLFSRHDAAIRYFASSQIIAEELGIGQTFQNEFITRLENNASNKDTLLQVISDFFLENDIYLKDHKQQDISALILAGGWIEGMYLGTSMINKSSTTKGIENIIAGQKYSLQNIITLLDGVEGKFTGIDGLRKNLVQLLSYYKNINYDPVTERDEDVTIEKTAEGELIIKTKEENISVDYITFTKIKNQVEEIRNQIIE